MWTGDKNPPISCIIDGIQISSGCTLGKGNISVILMVFQKHVFQTMMENNVEIVLKTDIQKEIDTTVTEENIIYYSEQIYQRPNQELFDIA
ncbi:formylmethanofuran dehydrogenase subunit E [Thermoplasmatales archaeon SCGC AB-540-F20]|nr:formylmethanofuran dehydrogenase subunit E [Thermoplasmatales archaeon SCGC AB-540-F20]